MMTDEQVEYFAEDVFGLADWACIATYLAENFNIDDCIQYDHEHGGTMFTYFQYEAVMNDMTPKEFADRQLSYGELFALDEEFDTAFIVDEDCEDDWSDKGLGANARITYSQLFFFRGGGVTARCLAAATQHAACFLDDR